MDTPLFPTANLGRHVRRVLGMMGLWLCFGLVVGSSVLPDNPIGILSGAIAGAMVMPWLGMILGIIGGQFNESLFGGLAGSLVAILLTVPRTGSVDSTSLNLGILLGGMIGANFAIFLAVRKWLRAGPLGVSH